MSASACLYRLHGQQVRHVPCLQPGSPLATKHIEIDIHFVRERVAFGQVWVLHVPSAYQYADIFTKGLPRQLFLDFRSSHIVFCL